MLGCIGLMMFGVIKIIYTTYVIVIMVIVLYIIGLFTDI